jgi:hypothetical protein
LLVGHEHNAPRVRQVLLDRAQACVQHRGKKSSQLSNGLSKYC